MHFVNVERSCKISGGPIYLLQLAAGLVERGHQYTFAARGGALSAAFGEIGATHLRTLSWPLNILQTGAYLRHHPADVFICSGRGRARLTALHLAERSKRPSVCILHDPLRPEQALAQLLRPTMLVALEPPLYEAALALGVPEQRLRLWPRPVRTRALAAPPAEGFRILHLGRLSGAKSASATTLIQAVDTLAPQIEGLQIVIAGGGGQASEVGELAEAANGRLGREVVRRVGEVLDPLAYIESSHLVVAGGYSCLEALCNGRPAIASGFGWLGPIHRGNVGQAETAHFGDRSDQPPSPQLVAEALTTVYDSLTRGEKTYLPQPEWMRTDHSIWHTASLMEELAMEMLQSVTARPTA